LSLANAFHPWQNMTPDFVRLQYLTGQVLPSVTQRVTFPLFLVKYFRAKLLGTLYKSSKMLDRHQKDNLSFNQENKSSVICVLLPIWKILHTQVGSNKV
jgi:hypothetical protein